jgi:hypothetical protein
MLSRIGDIMSLEIITPIDSVPKARDAVIKMKREFHAKKDLTPLEVQNRRMKIIEAFDIASSAAPNKDIKKIYRTARRELEDNDGAGT